MKKILAIAACAALSVSMWGLAACGDDGKKGEIKGDYKEPANAAEFDEALSNVKEETPFGDPTQEGYKAGLELASEFNTSLSFTGVSASEKLSIDYKLSMGKTGFTGSGNFAVKGETTMEMMGTSQKVEQNYSAKIYNDNMKVYADVNGISETALKAKVDLAELLGDFLTAPLAESEENVFETLAALKFSVGLDTKDGTKIKISATQETLWQLLVEADMSETEIAKVKEAVVVNSFAIDAYMAFDKDGYFSQASVVTDINLKVDLNKIKAMIPGDALPAEAAAMLTGEATFKLDGYASVKLYTGDITLPDGLATDTAYTDYTEILGGMIGDMLPGGSDDEIESNPVA